METRRPVKKKTVFISITLIVILGCLAYANSLNGKFLWDDDFLVTDNVYIKSFSYLPKIFTEDDGAGSGTRYNFYRPLRMLTYMIDYSLWKLDVRGYHFVNILLHILVGLSIYWLITLLFGDWLLSLLTSALFMVHPIHTEAIAFISGRTDPLSGVFMLLCFILYIKYLRLKTAKVYIFILLSYILAILSKEGALILPALLLLYHYTFEKKIQAKAFLSVIGVTFIYVVLRLTVLRSALAEPAYFTTVHQRIPGFFVAITNYIRILLFPFELRAIYGDKMFPFTHPKAIIGCLLTLWLLIYAFKKRRANRLIFFSVFWFFVMLLPVSGIYRIPFYMAEHYLYLPSIGFFLILAAGLGYLLRIEKLRIFTLFFVAGLLSFYLFQSIRQNIYWREPLAFFQRTLSYAPDSFEAYNNLGKAYRSIGQPEKAIAAYKKAIELKPEFAKSYYNLGVVYNDIGNTQEAIVSYIRAIEVFPQYADVYSNLGVIYKDMGKTQEAVAMFKQAIEINPQDADVYNNLGVVYKDMGKTQEAVAMFKKAIEIDLNCVEAYYNLGIGYQSLGRSQEAIAAYKQAIELNPNLAQGYNNLGRAYYNIGKTQEAIVSYKQAIKLNPDYAQAYYNLCIVYFQQNQYAVAIKYCDKARELGMDNAAVLEALN